MAHRGVIARSHPDRRNRIIYELFDRTISNRRGRVNGATGISAGASARRATAARCSSPPSARRNPHQQNRAEQAGSVAGSLICRTSPSSAVCQGRVIPTEEESRRSRHHGVGCRRFLASSECHFNCVGVFSMTRHQHGAFIARRVSTPRSARRSPSRTSATSSRCTGFPTAAPARRLAPGSSRSACSHCGMSCSSTS